MTDTFPPRFLPYDITICGLDELCEHGSSGITHVISILDPAHPDPEDFSGYPAHDRVVWRFDDVVEQVEDAVVPGAEQVAAVLETGKRLLAEPVGRLLIHCHAGVSRSTATAAILMAQNAPGREEEVFAEIARIRPRSWPNSRMVRFADEMLGRGGALSAALKAHHQRIAERHPDLARAIARYGRAHEVPGIETLLKQ
ncbi:protein-tyrosine-phosphatase [Arenibaculum sp.]|uniref:tyrosine phosphatase family protein n=1 Tax=Arenibaculum sp. TaxID=2865862 RepID=UPI002E0FC0F5|nr:protein-tyrosine-phosphatase [Arenibaculum sp.]